MEIAYAGTVANILVVAGAVEPHTRGRSPRRLAASATTWWIPSKSGANTRATTFFAPTRTFDHVAVTIGLKLEPCPEVAPLAVDS